MGVLASVGLAGAAPSATPKGQSRLAVWPRGVASPGFNLVDADGVPRTLSSYRGRVVVTFFGFMHCPDVCPAELLKLSRVMKELGEVAADVQVLFITLDPNRDTPAALKRYVSAFDPRFTGLTGTTTQIDQAANSFNVQYAHVQLGSDYTIDHATAVFLIDRTGRLRLIGAADSSVADFVDSINTLAAEKP